MKKEKLKILFEDKHLIIVFKKSRIPTIKSGNYKDNLYSLVYDYLHKRNQRVFVVHRLDADTSGIVVFAKSEKVKDNLQLNWENVKRGYIAVVHGITKDSDVIKTYLKETKTLLTYVSKDNSGKYAETSYEKIMNNRKYSLIKIDIKTGRKNQIRVHMQYNKTPIIGDSKYGIKDGFRDMYLMANRIMFVHPITRERINIDLDIPDKYIKIFKN